MSINTENKISENVNDPFYSKENMEILHKSLGDYRNGKMISHELIDA